MRTYDFAPSSGRPSVSIVFSTSPRPPSAASRKATRPPTSNASPKTVTTLQAVAGFSHRFNAGHSYSDF
jgi:molecular chaperone IbpA